MRCGEDNRVWLDAVLKPHLAMSAKGLRWVSVALLAPALFFGAIAIALKIWPVTMFLGGEAGLACMALYWSARRLSEQGERVVLTDDDLIVESWDQGVSLGRTRLEPSWARVEREFHDAHEGCEAVFIRSMRQRVQVAQALGPEERAAFADALEAALRQRMSNFVRMAA